MWCFRSIFLESLTNFYQNKINIKSVDICGISQYKITSFFRTSTILRHIIYATRRRNQSKVPVTRYWMHSDKSLVAQKPNKTHDVSSFIPFRYAYILEINFHKSRGGHFDRMQIPVSKALPLARNIYFIHLRRRGAKKGRERSDKFLYVLFCFFTETLMCSRKFDPIGY